MKKSWIPSGCVPLVLPGPYLRWHRVGLRLLLVGNVRHHLDAVLGDALPGGPTVVVAVLPRLHARGAAPHRGAVEATVGSVLRFVVSAPRVVERGLGAHPRRLRPAGLPPRGAATSPCPRPPDFPAPPVPPRARGPRARATRLRATLRRPFPMFPPVIPSVDCSGAHAATVHGRVVTARSFPPVPTACPSGAALASRARRVGGGSRPGRARRAGRRVAARGRSRV